MLGSLLRRGVGYGSSGFSKDASHVGKGESRLDMVFDNDDLNDTMITDGGVKSGTRFAKSSVLDHMSDDLKLKLFATKSIAIDDSASLDSNNALSSNDHFRLIIVEETGQMACRGGYRVVQDFSTFESSKMEQIRPSELREYIFGSPIRSSDTTQSDKIRTIPNSNIVLVSRIFYINSKTNRLAICLCLPSTLLSVITEAWPHISDWLDYSEATICSVIKKSKKSNQVHNTISSNAGSTCLLPPEIRNQYSTEFETILQYLQKKVILCLRSMHEVPRLFLYPADFGHFVESWFKEVLYWIEIKDGPNVPFLTTLIAKILLDFKKDIVTSETVRITIASGNMVIANKLILIISGLLEPKYRDNLQFHKHEVPTLKSFQHLSDNDQHSNNSFRSNASISIRHTRSATKLSTTNFAQNKFHSTNKGWEIPQRSSPSSAASVSSGESFGEVIQPSSFKNGSSLHQLYSSLNNYPSSYGSWFKNRPALVSQMQYGTSITSNDSWDKYAGINMQRSNSSGLSAQQQKQNFGLTPQHSPSISEYEEFPWFEAYNSHPSDFSTSYSNLSNAVYNSGTTATSNTTVLGTPENTSNAIFTESGQTACYKVERNYQRVSQANLVNSAFDKVCRPNVDLKCDVTVSALNGEYDNVLDVDIWDQYEEKKPIELLPRYTVFLKNYNSWFKLQAFPMSVDAEHKVLASMKRDLSMNKYAKTLLVSLGAREVKEVLFIKDSSRLIQKSNKIFCNGTTTNPTQELAACIAFVELTIQSALRILKDQKITSNQKPKQLTKLFTSLIQYKQTNKVQETNKQ